MAGPDASVDSGVLLCRRYGGRAIWLQSAVPGNDFCIHLLLERILEAIREEADAAADGQAGVAPNAIAAQVVPHVLVVGRARVHARVEGLHEQGEDRLKERVVAACDIEGKCAVR